jgi:hypothetical protein
MFDGLVSLITIDGEPFLLNPHTISSIERRSWEENSGAPVVTKTVCILTLEGRRYEIASDFPAMLGLFGEWMSATERFERSERAALRRNP